MQWNIKDHDDYRIVSYTSWRYLHNYGNFEERSGVYIFANSDHQVKYVGKAGARRMVVEISSAFNRGKHYGATMVKALYTNSEERALSLEGDIINKYNPPNNLR